MLAGCNSAKRRIVTSRPVCARAATSGSAFPSRPRLGREPVGCTQAGRACEHGQRGRHCRGAVPRARCFIIIRVQGYRVYHFNITDRGMSVERCRVGGRTQNHPCSFLTVHVHAAPCSFHSEFGVRADILKTQQVVKFSVARHSECVGTPPAPSCPGRQPPSVQRLHTPCSPPGSHCPRGQRDRLGITGLVFK